MRVHLKGQLKVEPFEFKMTSPDVKIYDRKIMNLFFWDNIQILLFFFTFRTEFKWNVISMFFVMLEKIKQLIYKNSSSIW